MSRSSFLLELEDEIFVPHAAVKSKKKSKINRNLIKTVFNKLKLLKRNLKIENNAKIPKNMIYEDKCSELFQKKNQS